MKNRAMFNLLMALASLWVAIGAMLFANAAYRLVPFLPLMGEGDSGWEMALFLFMTIMLLGVAFASLVVTFHLGREAYRDWRVWRTERTWRVDSPLRRQEGMRFRFYR